MRYSWAILNMVLKVSIHSFHSRCTISGGGGLPCSFLKTEKKYPNFAKKCPDFGKKVLCLCAAMREIFI